MSLRLQLSLVALVVVLLPLAGWQFVRVMEGLLRDGQEEAVLARADALATALTAESPMPDAGAASALYARRIGYPVSVDGYASDWDLWIPWAHEFGAAAGGDVPLTAVFARHERVLYGLLEVRDARSRYLTPDLGIGGADHVRFTLATPQGEASITVATAAPGSVEAGEGPFRLQGEWQETAAGYRLEFRLPASAAAGGLGFAAFDATDAGARLLAGTGEAGSPAAVLPLVGPDPDRGARLDALVPEGARLWLLDSRGWVLGRAGSVYGGDPGGDVDSGGWLRSVAYRYLLAPPLDPPRPRPDVAARLSGPEIDAALAGRPGVRWLESPRENTVLVSAAVPLEDASGSVAGVLLLERPTDALLTFTNSAVLRLVGLTLVAFAAVALALLVFASVLSLRIRRLRNAAERALTPDGRVRADFPVPRASDEVGDLGRSFSRLLAELRTHTEYLRTLADKLSHELRTPIAMIRSSLDNLEMEPLEGDARRYAHRAREGADRMAMIVRAMSEASRIEESVREMASEQFDLGDLVRTQLDSWIELRADREFRVETPDGPLPVVASPELISRLLDKLIENAVDFTPGDGLIRVTVDGSGTGRRLKVYNEGPPVPRELEGRMFDSMTTGGRRAGDQPHLGLGLYIARLIAEHHGGSIGARNANGGVEFQVEISVDARVSGMNQVRGSR